MEVTLVLTFGVMATKIEKQSFLGRKQGDFSVASNRKLNSKGYKQ